MFKILILPCIGIVLLLQFRSFKETKNYRINERKESLYIDTTGTIEEYINKQININRYEHRN
jgi:hypothetical protein